MGSDRILGLLIAVSAMFSLRIYPTANGIYLFLVRPKIGLTTGTWYHTYMYTYIHYSMAYMYVRALLLRTYICLYVAIILGHVCVPICAYVYPLVTPY